jgi:hypothetical protein
MASPVTARTVPSYSWSPALTVYVRLSAPLTTRLVAVASFEHAAHGDFRRTPEDRRFPSVASGPRRQTPRSSAESD